MTIQETTEQAITQLAALQIDQQTNTTLKELSSTEECSANVDAFLTKPRAGHTLLTVLNAARKCHVSSPVIVGDGLGSLLGYEFLSARCPATLSQEYLEAAKAELAIPASGFTILFRDAPPAKVALLHETLRLILKDKDSLSDRCPTDGSFRFDDILFTFKECSSPIEVEIRENNSIRILGNEHADQWCADTIVKASQALPGTRHAALWRLKPEELSDKQYEAALHLFSACCLRRHPHILCCNPLGQHTLVFMDGSRYRTNFSLARALQQFLTIEDPGVLKPLFEAIFKDITHDLKPSAPFEELLQKEPLHLRKGTYFARVLVASLTQDCSVLSQLIPELDTTSEEQKEMILGALRQLFELPIPSELTETSWIECLLTSNRESYKRIGTTLFYSLKGNIEFKMRWIKALPDRLSIIMKIENEPEVTEAHVAELLQLDNGLAWNSLFTSPTGRWRAFCARTCPEKVIPSLQALDIKSRAQLVARRKDFLHVLPPDTAIGFLRAFQIELNDDDKSLLLTCMQQPLNPKNVEWLRTSVKFNALAECRAHLQTNKKRSQAKQI